MGIALDEFRRLVAQELGVDVARVMPDASFVEDLLADSIQLVEMSGMIWICRTSLNCAGSSSVAKERAIISWLVQPSIARG